MTGPRPGTAGERRFAARCAATGAGTDGARTIGPVSGDALTVAAGRHVPGQRRVTFRAPDGELLIAVHIGCDEPHGSDRRGEFGIYDGAGQEVTLFEFGGLDPDPDDLDDDHIARTARRVIEEEW